MALSHPLISTAYTPNCVWLYLRVNVGCGPAEERVLLTGLHAVADIYCENCKTTLGWKYVSILGWFGSPTHRLHPRLEGDGVEGGVVQHPHFTCASVICGPQIPAMASAGTLNGTKEGFAKTHVDEMNFDLNESWRRTENDGGGGRQHNYEYDTGLETIKGKPRSPQAYSAFCSPECCEGLWRATCSLTRVLLNSSPPQQAAGQGQNPKTTRSLWSGVQDCDKKYRVLHLLTDHSSLALDKCFEMSKHENKQTKT